MHGSGMTGLPLLWFGVAGLGVFAFVEFTRLVRR
jgi:hypothetical protein